MKWNQEDLNIAVNWLNCGKTYAEIAEALDRTPKSVQIKLSKQGLAYRALNPSTEERRCKRCNNSFVAYKSSEAKFCSRSCSSSENNVLFVKRVRVQRKTCMFCNSSLSNKKIGSKYCSLDCQALHRQRLIEKRIEAGDTSLHVGQYRKYLIKKCGPKCVECGWSKENPVTRKVPIQLDHIDGDHKNNALSNLRLLCPNCHSLTPTFMALNVGNGREKRRKANLQMGM